MAIEALLVDFISQKRIGSLNLGKLGDTGYRNDSILPRIGETLIINDHHYSVTDIQYVLEDASRDGVKPEKRSFDRYEEIKIILQNNGSPLKGRQTR